jgi:hypothetical protein
MRSFLAGVAAVLSPFAVAFTVSVNTSKLGFYAGRTSGHEEITRQAMNRLEEILKANQVDLKAAAPKFLGDRDAAFFGTKGFISQNKVIQGNYATDWPDQLLSQFNLPKWHKEPLEGWQNNPNMQILHFLQNIKSDNTLVSQKESCLIAREKILKATREGVIQWIAGKKSKALFMFGHATHTIQDSFSPAHTVRGPSDRNNDVLRICYYGSAQSTDPGDCYHKIVDARDGIWIRTDEQENLTKLEWPNEEVEQIPYAPFATSFISREAKESALKHEARLARLATIRYLYLVALYLKGIDGGLIDKDFKVLPEFITERFFEGVTGFEPVDQGVAKPVAGAAIHMSEGAIRCDRLDPSALAPEPSEEETKKFEQSDEGKAGEHAHGEGDELFGAGPDKRPPEAP